jgi:hypothetical protein
VSLVRLAPLALTGCATLFAAGPDRVPVMTNPPGAYVYLNGAPVGQTPMYLLLDRDRAAAIQIYLPGFAPVQLERGKEFNTWFIGSIILVGLIVPLIVDLATGNYQRYDDGTIAIGLVPLAGPAPAWSQQPRQPEIMTPTYQPPPTSQPPIVTPPSAPPPPKP